jgi:hypothetical protein
MRSGDLDFNQCAARFIRVHPRHPWFDYLCKFFGFDE